MYRRFVCDGIEDLLRVGSEGIIDEMDALWGFCFRNFLKFSLKILNFKVVWKFKNF